MTLQEFLAAGAEQQLAKAKANRESWEASWKALAKNARENWYDPGRFQNHLTADQLRGGFEKAKLDLLRVRLGLEGIPYFPSYYPTSSPRNIDEYEGVVNPFDLDDWEWGTE